MTFAVGRRMAACAVAAVMGMVLATVMPFRPRSAARCISGLRNCVSERSLIGVDPRQMAPSLQRTCGNARVWVNEELWNPTELAVKVRYELARIHTFPNGNDHHARLMADTLLIHRFKLDPLPWGRANLIASCRAMMPTPRQADVGDFRPIASFAAS